MRKITEVGQACDKCGTPVVRTAKRQHRQLTGQTYYYEWSLRCLKCNAVYLVEAARRYYPDGVSVVNVAPPEQMKLL